MTENSKKPILFTSDDECCGCGACCDVCAQNAVSLIKDRKGFLYPHINYDLCVNCGLCLKVCAFKF